MSQPKSNEGYKDTAERYVREQIEARDGDTVVIKPQLQHWLSVIRTFDIAVKDENLLEVRTFERETPVSKKPIRKKVFFNLITGQPATEAYYKAFCEIVGITSKDKKDV